MKILVTRRQLVLTLIAVMGGSAAGFWSIAGRDETGVELVLPPPGNPMFPSLETFRALSQIAFARTVLDETLVRRMYEIFMDEPWGPKHIGTAYAVLYRALGQAKSENWKLAEWLPLLGPGEKWFVSHLITTYYLGIYYHEQRPTRRVTYEDAAMFDAIRGILPVPFLESTGFGTWTDPPPNAQAKKL
jgi:D-sorbitol dehydrogenase-like protein